MDSLPYSIVISTYERAGPLAEALDSLIPQSRQPSAVIIVDSSESSDTRELCARYVDRLALRCLRADEPSAAVQRNQGADLVGTPLVAFMDDDVVLGPRHFDQLCLPFDRDGECRVGGVAGRIEGLGHPRPRGLLWWYYRLQAGYAHPDYGARLFGPAINCLPCYESAEDELIPAEWLNSTCVVYRRAAFLAERFPVFPGYSFMEDVHLSARIGKSLALYFHRDAVYAHNSRPSKFKNDHRTLARNRIRNQRAVAVDVLGRGGPVFKVKFLLHRLFISLSILRGGGDGRWQELIGTWS